MTSLCLPIQKQPLGGVSESLFNSRSLNETKEIDPETLSSITQLLKLYSMHANRNCDVERPVVSGGLQQYMTKKSKERMEAQHNDPESDSNNQMNFNQLPINIQLHIASYIDAADLCRMARVCWTWFSVATDNLLWQHKLDSDSQKWNIIGHNTNPLMYKECQSEWSIKEIYLKCSPKVNQHIKQNNSGFNQLSSILRSLWPKKTPKLAMFGPGLESATRFLVRKILEDKTDLFKRIGMFPGQFEGLGSGFTLNMNSVIFQLVTLYTATAAERVARAPHERQQNNRLMAGLQHQDVDAEQMVYEIREPVKDLCRTLDGFIFVVDATQDKAAVEAGRQELMAMTSELWASHHIPVVVLSCIPDDSHHSHMSCMQVIERLRLGEMTRPWQVHQCTVDTMQGLDGAIQWAVGHAQRN